MAASATPFIVFGSVIAWAYLSRAWRRKHKARVLKRSMSVGALHGGNLALQRLIEYQEARANAETLEIAECELTTSLAEENPNFRKLQTIIAKMEMCGKEAKAVKILEKAYEKAIDEGQPHEAYEIEMLLVETLIYKGDFLAAFNRKCLRDEKMSDARRPLYKAIIHIMLNNPEDEIKKCWQKFEEIRQHFHCTPTFQESMQESGLHNLSANFDEFKSVVLKLKDDIDKVHGKKTKK
ncbi:hypothetical protein FNV43_RR06009 [Rhamnella rubrinervis]|uniref:Uncharacterized protein n=1 Tax=Rhamnella rubrinervis TaxID=2594499 RepID=A0A8K0MLK2_9ROSA|nr:hypothetical protein FNV43_RR06009 [Rhamnella rubrinervis]